MTSLQIRDIFVEILFMKYNEILGKYLFLFTTNSF